MLQVVGQDVSPQNIRVTLSVQTGLGQVSVKVTNKKFIYDQSGLHPASQTITITNKSDQDFTWNLSYSGNTWLQVTPGEDTLRAGASEVLKVTANVQDLSAPNTLFATVTITGRLANQGDGRRDTAIPDYGRRAAPVRHRRARMGGSCRLLAHRENDGVLSGSPLRIAVT